MLVMFDYMTGMGRRYQLGLDIDGEAAGDLSGYVSKSIL